MELVSGQTEKRINYQFKILYALGMFLVVSNHCATGAFSFFYEFFPAYSFHVGLFIFCSGYFYKDSVEKSIGSIALYIFKKIKTLVVPLYLWNCFYALFTQLLSLRGFNVTGFSFDKLLIKPMTNGHQFGYNLASWFVFPLFTILVLNVVLRKLLFMLKGTVKEVVYVLISLAVGMLGIYLSTKGWNTKEWGLVLTRMLTLFPFYSVGYFYKSTLEKIDKLPNFIYLGIVLLAETAIIVYKGHVLTWEQAWCRYSDLSPLPYVVGFLAIAFWLRMARILEPSIGKSKVVNLIADNSFSIMVNQFLGFLLVKSCCAFAFQHFGVCSGFDLDTYHKTIWYFYLPKGMMQTRLVYIVVSIALAILIQKVVDWIKGRLFKGEDKKLISIKRIIVYAVVVIITVVPAALI